MARKSKVEINTLHIKIRNGSAGCINNNDRA